MVSVASRSAQLRQKFEAICPGRVISMFYLSANSIWGRQNRTRTIATRYKSDGATMIATLRPFWVPLYL
jgi:hypothetical protein